MPNLWVPNEAAQSLVDEYNSRAEAARTLEFSKRLKAIDSRLDCFLQASNIEHLRAGFYYIRRHNEDGTTTLWEVANPDGSFREPDEAVLESFRKGDANRSENRGRLRREAQKRKEQAQKKRASRQDELEWRISERVNHVLDTSISVPKQIA